MPLSESELLEYLETFSNKVFYPEETIIIDFLGNIRKLEDQTYFHLLRPEHYILIQAHNLPTEAQLQDTLDTFQQDLTQNWDAYLMELVVSMIKDIKAQESVELQTKVINAFLTNLLGNAKKPAKHYLSFISNFNDKPLIEELKYELFEHYDARVHQQLQDSSWNKALLQECKTLIKDKNHPTKYDFIKKQALRLLNNQYTQPIFSAVLDKDTVKYIVTSEHDVFLRLAGHAKNQSTAGAAKLETNLIFIFWGKLFNEFPNLSLLGGLSFEDGFNCFSHPSDQKRKLESDAPVLRLLAEETFDFWFETHKRAGKLHSVMPKNSSNFVNKLRGIINNHKAIAESVLSHQKLKKSEQKLWKKMKKEARSIYNSANPTTGKLISTIATKIPIGTTATATRDGAQVDLTLKEFLEESTGFVCSNPQVKPGLWKLDTAKSFSIAPNSDVEFTDFQAAKLYQYLASQYLQIFEDVSSKYKDYDPLPETLGKAFAYKVFAPGYMEEFLPDFNELYEALYEGSEDLNTFEVDSKLCMDGLCFRQCITDVHSEFSLSPNPILTPSSTFEASNITSPTNLEIVAGAAAFLLILRSAKHTVISVYNWLTTPAASSNSDKTPIESQNRFRLHATKTSDRINDDCQKISTSSLSTTFN